MEKKDGRDFPWFRFLCADGSASSRQDGSGRPRFVPRERLVAYAEYVQALLAAVEQDARYAQARRLVAPLYNVQTALARELASGAEEFPFHEVILRRL